MTIIQYPLTGLYCYRPASELDAAQPPVAQATLLGSGPLLRTALDAQHELATRYQVHADVWSATSYKALREDALECERWNRLHPGAERRVAHVEAMLADAPGPVVAVTDFQKSVPDQIARFVAQPFVPLGTDGFGFSDTRDALRAHFEIDTAHIVVATLEALARSGAVPMALVDDAITHYGIDPDAPDPRTC